MRITKHPKRAKRVSIYGLVKALTGTHWHLKSAKSAHGVFVSTSPLESEVGASSEGSLLEKNAF
jgi:hypothetical protein